MNTMGLPRDIKVGDTVRLRSGGPLMTVTDISRPGDNDPRKPDVIRCIWFRSNDGQLDTAYFSRPALEPTGG